MLHPLDLDPFLAVEEAEYLFQSEFFLVVEVLGHQN